MGRIVGRHVHRCRKSGAQINIHPLFVFPWSKIHDRQNNSGFVDLILLLLTRHESLKASVFKISARTF